MMNACVMSKAAYLRNLSFGLLVTLLGALLFPAKIRGQGIARNALSSFPADTHQFVYTNLDQLRNSSQYPKIRQRLFGGQLGSFADFLRSAGADPEKDVDEVVLGWRGGGASPPGERPRARRTGGWREASSRRLIWARS